MNFYAHKIFDHLCINFVKGAVYILDIRVLWRVIQSYIFWCFVDAIQFFKGTFMKTVYILDFKGDFNSIILLCVVNITHFLQEEIYLIIGDLCLS